MKFFVPNPLFATRRSAIIIVWRKEITTKVKFCVLKRDQELYLSKTELHINFSDPGQLNKTLETSILASLSFFKYWQQRKLWILVKWVLEIEL